MLRSHGHSLTLLSDMEWTKLAGLAALLEPCEIASTMLGGHMYVSCSMVLPVWRQLQREFQPSDDDPGYSRRFKEAFLNDAQSRYVIIILLKSQTYMELFAKLLILK